MDINSLYYFSELAKDLHMTRCASRLFISQQTLSNHILRLEEYYGTPLFTRKPSLALTEAGKRVLDFSREVLREETSLKDVLGEIAGEERGVVRLGGTQIRLNVILPGLLPEFSRHYPKVELDITVDISRNLEKMMRNGELDLAVVFAHGENPDLVRRGEMQDQVYLCVADGLLKEYYGKSAEKLKRSALQGAVVSDFAELPFCMLTNRLGRTVEECFDIAGIKPRIYMKSLLTMISTQISFIGLAACFVPQMILVSMVRQIPPDLNIFPLCYAPGKPVTVPLATISHKDRYLPRYMRFLQDQICGYFEYVEKFQMERLAEENPESSALPL